MDIQTSPGYFMKLVDDIQDKRVAEVHTNSNSNMNAQVTYLLNLEQADGTCQAVQLTEEEARSFGILINGTTSDNTNSTTNSIETTTNLACSVENTNLIIQPTKPLNNVITNYKKPVNIRQKSVDICNNSKLNEKPMEVNLLPYSSAMLHRNDSPNTLQVTDEIGMFLNNSENSTTKSNKTVITNSMEIANASLNKQPVKVSSKALARHRKAVNFRKKAPTDTCSKDSQKRKPPKVKLLSSIILQGNGTSPLVQLTEQQVKSLGISVSDTTTTIANNVTTTVEATKSIINPIDVNNTNVVDNIVYSTVPSYNSVVSNENNSATNYNSKNSNQKMGNVDILCYSATNENCEGLQLSEEQVQAFGILPNGATNSVEVSKNVIRNAAETINTNLVKHHSKFSNKAVARRKETVRITKNSTVKICNSSSADKSMESIKPLGSCENPIEIIKDGEVLHSTQNLSQDYLQQIAEALQFKAVESDKVEEEKNTTDKSTNVIYRVVYPEELDLNPKPKQLKRGRPKKRLLSSSEEKPEIIPEEPKPAKNMRTRSGRITRPPQHIQKDFKKFETSEVDNMEADLKIVEFEPLTTNQPPTAADTPVKINQLENHQKKRSIASQFRCPKCKKAYLGRSKMLKHLQKHPDHGPVPDHCKVKDDETWNYLMDLCNKSPIGQKGLKFCRELVNFLRNVRILAKMFFRRPTCLDKNLYFVDSNLSNVFGIESGSYVLNESELHTEVSMLSFLNSKCVKDGNTEFSENFSNSDTKLHNESFDLDAFVETCQTANHEVLHENLTFPENGHHNVLNGVNNNDFSHKLNTNENNKNSKCNGTIEDTNFHENKLSFDTIQSSQDNGFSLNCDITSVSEFNPELQKYNDHIIGNFSEGTVNTIDENKNTHLDISNSTSQAHEQKSINADLSLHSELLSDNSLLNSLPNLRTSVEELMLNNVDSTQVTNLLDNSTSSDEVMNVDQFVNERFKNLTESDLELPNTSLNLDLPSLDLFQFHTS